MNYIKKIVSNKSEAKYIKMDLIESEGFIHKIILVEANFSHSGIKRTYQFQEVIESDYFSKEEKSRLIYLKIDINKLVYKNTISFKELHLNERVIRGKFVDYLTFNSTDIIFSLDADEVLYRDSYGELINKVQKNNKAYQLKLTNVIYRPDYIWHSCRFIAPTVCYYGFYDNLFMKIKTRFKKYKQWRYHGEVIENPKGVHFNWHLTSKEMLSKIKNYSHADQFTHIDSSEFLKECKKGKLFFWNTNIKNEIVVDKSYSLLPNSFSILKNELSHLMEN